MSVPCSSDRRYHHTLPLSWPFFVDREWPNRCDYSWLESPGANTGSSESDGDAAPGAPHRPSEVAGGPGAHASPKPGMGPSGGAGQSPAGAGPNPPPLGSRADVPRSRPRKTCLSRPATRPGSPVSLAATPRRDARRPSRRRSCRPSPSGPRTCRAPDVARTSLPHRAGQVSSDQPDRMPYLPLP